MSREKKSVKESYFWKEQNRSCEVCRCSQTNHTGEMVKWLCCNYRFSRRFDPGAVKINPPTCRWVSVVHGLILVALGLNSTGNPEVLTHTHVMREWPFWVNCISQIWGKRDDVFDLINFEWNWVPLASRGIIGCFVLVYFFPSVVISRAHKVEWNIARTPHKLL